MYTILAYKNDVVINNESSQTNVGCAEANYLN